MCFELSFFQTLLFCLHSENVEISSNLNLYSTILMWSSKSPGIFALSTRKWETAIVYLYIHSCVSILCHRMKKGFSRISRTENLVNSHWHDMTVIIQLEFSMPVRLGKIYKRSRDKNRIQSLTHGSEKINSFSSLVIQIHEVLPNLTNVPIAKKKVMTFRSIFFVSLAFALWFLELCALKPPTNYLQILILCLFPCDYYSSCCRCVC